MKTTFKDLLAEHTKKATQLPKLAGGNRAAAADALVALEDALWRAGEHDYDFAHRALFLGYSERLSALIAQKQYREATSIAVKLARGDRLTWALQYSRGEATRVIKLMLKAYFVDDKHSKGSYSNTFLTVRGYAADLHQFMNFEIAAYECEHGDIERGLNALATLNPGELRGLYTHRAFARVREHETFLQILSSKGALPKAIAKQREQAKTTIGNAPEGAITEKDLPVAIKGKGSAFAFVYWPSGHLKSASTRRGSLRLDEQPGSGSVSMLSSGASLSESYHNGVASWSIGTAWNDGDDGGEERIAFVTWVRKWLKELDVSSKR